MSNRRRNYNLPFGKYESKMYQDLMQRTFVSDFRFKNYMHLQSHNFPHINYRASRTATRLYSASEGSADESVNFGDHG